MENVKSVEVLKQIVDNFLSQIPLKCFTKQMLEYIFNNSEEVFQSTILHELNRKYPLKKSYQVSFLKHIIHALEKNYEEVDESLYYHYLNFIEEPDTETHYIHFAITDEKYISLLQNSSIISDGTTGLSIWQAGKTMAEYCSRNKHLFAKMNILELGCGIGFTGLAVTSLCNPIHYCFSDCHEKVIDYLINNIEINAPNHSSICRNDKKNEIYLECNYGETKLSVVNLQWENARDSIFCESFNPDVILAADVIYDSKLFQPLCNVFKIFIEKNKNVKIFIACTLRNSSTLDEFLTVLHNNLLENEVINMTKGSSCFNDEYVVKIFSIFPTKSNSSKQVT